MVLNTIFKSTVQRDKSNMYYQMDRLIYAYKNNELTVPYVENFKGFRIELVEEDAFVLIEAISESTQKGVAYLKFHANE